MRLFRSAWRCMLTPVSLGLRLVFRGPLARAEAGLSSARVLIPPAPAKFTGASWLRRPRGDGVIALTAEELRFWPLLGSPIRILRQEIQGAHLARWFKGYLRAGKRHLVLELSGERRIAFIVSSPEEWMRILTAKDEAAW